MPEAVQKTLRFVSEQMLHQMVLAKLLLFVIGSLGTSIMVALAGTQWSESDGQTKFLIVVSIFVNLSTTLGAFLDKSLSRAARGEDPLVNETNAPIPSR